MNQDPAIGVPVRREDLLVDWFVCDQETCVPLCGYLVRFLPLRSVKELSQVTDVNEWKSLCQNMGKY